MTRQCVIQRVRAESFKSLQRADAALSPLTVLVGANSSGKSSLSPGASSCWRKRRGRRRPRLRSRSTVVSWSWGISRICEAVETHDDEAVTPERCSRSWTRPPIRDSR